MVLVATEDLITIKDHAMIERGGGRHEMRKGREEEVQINNYF